MKEDCARDEPSREKMMRCLRRLNNPEFEIGETRRRQELVEKERTDNCDAIPIENRHIVAFIRAEKEPLCSGGSHCLPQHEKSGRQAL